MSLVAQWLGREAFDQAVMGLIPSWGTQPSIPLGCVNRVPALMAGVKVGFARLCWAAGKIV